jgi:twinkle protein
MSALSDLSGEVLALLGHRDHARTICPSCSPERKKSKETCLSIDRKDNGIVWTCHHCGWSGMSPYRQFTPRKAMSAIEKPIGNSLTPKAISYLNSRGISEQTAKSANLYSTSRYIQKVGGEVSCIAFPYMRGGNVVNIKYRSIEQKGFSQETNGDQIFYLLDDLDTTLPIVIVEGEIDALTCIEAGVKNVLSVPSGAPIKVSEGRVDPTEDRKFSFVWDANKQINAAPYIVIASDGDIAGTALKEELARRIGKAKCRVISYPEGCKDLNDVLTKYGSDKVKELVEDANPYPIDGLFDASEYADAVADLYNKGFGSGESTGYTNVDELYTVVPGQVTIVTGYPSSGKSNFVDQILTNLAMCKDWKFAICSFENPPPLHIAKLCELYLKKPFFAGITPRMTEEDRNVAMQFVKEHFVFLDSQNSENTIESILDRAQSAVQRLGIRGLVIDPYNFINLQREGTETDAISKMLTKVQAFAKSAGVHIWFVAHPAKMLRMGDDMPVPDGMSVAGSMAWWAKADNGLTVHRQEANNVLIKVWKCRWRWVGKVGETTLKYEKATGSYYEDYL